MARRSLAARHAALNMAPARPARPRCGLRAAHLLVLLACALLAPLAEAKGAAARSASSASGGAASTATGAQIVGSLAAVLDNSPAAVAAKNQVVAQVSPVLQGVSLRCADIFIMRTGATWNDAGDGFAHLSQENPNLLPLMASIAQTPINGTYKLSPDILDGVNVWLLGYIADAAGMSISYETVFLPDALFYSGNRTAQMLYLFDTLGYDCIVSNTIMRGERLAFADFLMPNEQFGLSVFTRLLPAAEYPAIKMLFAWTEPFSWQIWVTVVSALVFGGIAMYFFEGEDEGEDYGPSELNPILRIGRGCYKAFLNFSSVGGFSPNTPAGQMFNITFSFSMLLLQAAYTANLAAFFTRTQGAASPINDMGDFGGKQMAACVLKDTFVIDMLRSAFPLTQLVVLNSVEMVDLLTAVQNGTCAGGVAPNLMLRYALGPQDPYGRFCNLDFTGGLLSQQYFGIPFNRNSPSVNSSVLDAMNAIAANAFAYGEYATLASLSAFPQEREACAGFTAASAQNPLAALRIRQVSGIFFLPAFGFGTALLFYGAFRVYGLGKVDTDTEVERALKARQRADLAALQADEASGAVDGSRLGNDGKPIRASSAAWLARINGGGATNSSAAAAAGGPGGGSPSLEVSKTVAVEALAAALAREAAAVMDVPSRTTAAIERAVATRGAYMLVSVRMFDAAGNPYGQEIEAGPFTRPADWQFMYTRLAPDEAAEFNRAVRAVVAGNPTRPAREREYPSPDRRLAAVSASPKLQRPLEARSADPRLLGTRSADPRLAARSANPRLEEVLVQRPYDSLGAASAGARRSRNAPPPPPPPPQPPIALPSMRTLGNFFSFNRGQEAPEPPPAEAKARRRRPPSEDGSDRGARTARSAPPGRRRRQIPAFDE